MASFLQAIDSGEPPGIQPARPQQTTNFAEDCETVSTTADNSVVTGYELWDSETWWPWEFSTRFPDLDDHPAM